MGPPEGFHAGLAFRQIDFEAMALARLGIESRASASLHRIPSTNTRSRHVGGIG